MAKETLSPKVKHASPTKRRGIHPGDKVVKRGTSRHSTGFTAQGQDLFSQLIADRREQAEQARLDRLAEALAFRESQAAKAREHEWFSQLKPNSTAYRMAVAMLEAFPTADPDPSQNLSRTKVAAIEALDRMSSSDMLQEGALNHGRNVARTALGWAYEELRSKA